MSKSNPISLLSSRLLARNTLLNFAGQAAPLLIALFAIPLIIGGFGTDRFGVLTLAWVLIGYFTVFDLGLSRVLTKLVAERLGTEYEREIPTIVWTTLSLMLLLGLVGTAFLSLLAPLLVGDLLKIPEALRSESLRTFYLLALSLPIIISTAGLRGVLEAQQRFGHYATPTRW
jgi:O-antigen/teichoic acid export membrane protein